MKSVRCLEATCKQETDQDLSQHFQKMKFLLKDYNPRTLVAEQNENAVHDTFTSEQQPSSIRQRILKNKSDQQTALEIARSLEVTQQQSCLPDATDPVRSFGHNSLQFN